MTCWFVTVVYGDTVFEPKYANFSIHSALRGEDLIDRVSREARLRYGERAIVVGIENLDKLNEEASEIIDKVSEIPLIYAVTTKELDKLIKGE